MFNPAPPCRAPGIRAAALAVVLFAVVEPQPAAAGPVALTYAKAAAWLRGEHVGNRTSNVEQSGTAARFTSKAKIHLTGRQKGKDSRPLCGSNGGANALTFVPGGRMLDAFKLLRGLPTRFSRRIIKPEGIYPVEHE